MNFRWLAINLVLCVTWWAFTMTHIKGHYDAWFQESQFIYNPMMAGHSLIENNPENLYLLVRTFPPPHSSIDVIHQPGSFSITYAIHAVWLENGRTWAVYRQKLASVRIDSEIWYEMRDSLKREAAKIHRMKRSAQLNAYLKDDLIMLFGPSALLFFPMILSKFRKELLARTSKYHFPDL